jgi:hypothetical protein
MGWRSGYRSIAALGYLLGYGLLGLASGLLWLLRGLLLLLLAFYLSSLINNAMITSTLSDGFFWTTNHSKSRAIMA